MMATLPPSPFDRDRRNRRTMMAMAGVGLSMLALGFASVPLYRIFCEQTGFGGTTKRASADVQVREAVGISGDGKRIFARCMTDTVVAFSASASTPETAWVTDCKYGYDIDPSMPMEKEGVLFFGTKNGIVYALDGASGNILWRHRVGVTIVHTPVPLGRNRVLITDQDGRIILVENSKQ